MDHFLCLFDTPNFPDAIKKGSHIFTLRNLFGEKDLFCTKQKVEEQSFSQVTNGFSDFFFLM